MFATLWSVGYVIKDGGNKFSKVCQSRNQIISILKVMKEKTFINMPVQSL